MAPVRTLAGLLLALVAGLTFSACGGSTGESAPNAETTTETQPVDSSREQAPAVDGQALDGTSVALADFRGKPVLVNVWSSW